MCTRHGFVVVFIQVQSTVEHHDERSLKKAKTYNILQHPKAKRLAINAWFNIDRFNGGCRLILWCQIEILHPILETVLYIVRCEWKIQNNKPSNDATYIE